LGQYLKGKDQGGDREKNKKTFRREEKGNPQEALGKYIKDEPAIGKFCWGHKPKKKGGSQGIDTNKQGRGGKKSRLKTGEGGSHGICFEEKKVKSKNWGARWKR